MWMVAYDSLKQDMLKTISFLVSLLLVLTFIFCLEKANAFDIFYTITFHYFNSIVTLSYNIGATGYSNYI